MTLCGGHFAKHSLKLPFPPQPMKDLSLPLSPYTNSLGHGVRKIYTRIKVLGTSFKVGIVVPFDVGQTLCMKLLIYIAFFGED